MNCDKQEIASSKMILDSLGPTSNQIKDNTDKDVSNNDEKSVDVNDVDNLKDVEMNGDVETKRISVSTQTDAINLNEVSFSYSLFTQTFYIKLFFQM